MKKFRVKKDYQNINVITKININTPLIVGLFSGKTQLILKKLTLLLNKEIFLKPDFLIITEKTLLLKKNREI